MLIDDQDKSVSLKGEPFNSGGEGKVYRTDRPGFLAKIYIKLPMEPEQIEKLKVMVGNPPPNIIQDNHIKIAWPTSRLRDTDKNNQYVGFLMREVGRNVELIGAYSPLFRPKILPGYNWGHLHIVAYNFTNVVHSLHIRDCIIGDIKPQNILVNDQAQISLVDTDSFQIRNGNIVYRCRVETPGFSPPELIGLDPNSISQTLYDDRYRVALIIYHLLFGRHPFDEGSWQGNENEPSQVDKIKNGIWWYGKPDLLKPDRYTIPLDILHPELKKLFLKCFNDGHNNPIERPTTEDWLNALTIAINNLKACDKVDTHRYSSTSTYGKCYWCDRSQALNFDIFPGKAPTSPPQPINIPQRPQPRPVVPRPQPIVPIPQPMPITRSPKSPLPKKSIQRSFGFVTAVLSVIVSPLYLSILSPGIAVILFIVGVVIFFSA